MFEIGFSELLMVGVVALLILGPQRLPHAARTAGQWLGKTRRMMNTIKTQLERELAVDELRQQLTSPPLQQLEQDIRLGIVAQAPAAQTPVAQTPGETPHTGTTPT